MYEEQYKKELDLCVKTILESDAPKKLIVAGPGTGKTTFFKKALKHYGGGEKDYLALTFINSLKDELHKELEGNAKVYTFHGYCHSLLRKDANSRYGLQKDFDYYPPLIKLIKSDWKILNKTDDAPEFVKLMRNVVSDAETDFFLQRGNNYNTIGYDDSVFRIFKSFAEGNPFKERYKLVIVDEYQDFNALETSVLSNIIEHNPTLVVGDDDQALYCTLRDSNLEFIRKLFKGSDFKNFELPYCLRCPKAVIEVFNQLINFARAKNLLKNRIDKKFNFFPPSKQQDSEKYPRVKIVISSIQKKTPCAANYLGRYILGEIRKIDKNEIRGSHEGQFPTVLIIGPNYYLQTLIPLFDKEGYEYELREEQKDLEVKNEDAYKFLKDDEKSNLGWRIVLEAERPDFYSESIYNSQTKNLIDLIPEDFMEEKLSKVRLYENKEETTVEEKKVDESKPTIRFTTFEGAKGLSAQHVFILGLQNGLLPRNTESITDIEVCKFLVAITRARKQCYVLSTNNFGGKRTCPSEFLNWMGKDYIEYIKINKTYWEK